MGCYKRRYVVYFAQINAESTVDMSKYKLRSVEKFSTKPIQSVDTYVSLDTACIIAGSSDRIIRYLDEDSLEVVAQCKVEKKSVNFVAISEMGPDGDDPIIVTGGKDCSVQIWSPSDGTVDKNIELPTNEVRSLAVYQGSATYIVVGTKDAKVIVWDVRKNVLVTIFEGHKASVHCVSITSSALDTENGIDLASLCIASGGADRTVRTWDMSTGRKKKKFRHKRSIASMVVANKGIRPLLATGGVERVIKLWDVESGILLRTLEGHSDQINSLHLYEGFQMLLISGSADHTIRVYDILSGECICLLLGHTESVLSVTTCDSTKPKIISSSEDLSVIQWSLQGVIEDFFCTDEENLGLRNDRPAYLPVIDYVAPPELDRTVLTKEERKRIRKEMKRAKRAKVLNSLSQDGREKAGSSISRDAAEEKYEDEDFEDYPEPAADSREELLKDCQAQPAAAVEPALTLEKLGSSNRILPEEAAANGVVVRRATVKAVKNIMSKVLGFGSAATVAIEPSIEEVVEEDEDLIKFEESVRAAEQQANPDAPKKPEDDEHNLRAMAKAAQSKFKNAQIEKELQEDRMKSKAAEKLAFRLNMKKLQNKGAASGEPATLGSEAESEAQMQAVKAEKLRQHKMQDSRRKQSMLAAKERSQQALQKRLDELAKKKAMNAAQMGALEEEDSEEDSDNEKSKKPSGEAKNSNSDEIAATPISSPAPFGNRRHTKVVYISDEEEEFVSDND